MLMKSIIKKFILLAGLAGADACVDVPSAMRDRLSFHLPPAPEGIMGP
jgi:hypothetical protein